MNQSIFTMLTLINIHFFNLFQMNEYNLRLFLSFLLFSYFSHQIDMQI